MKDIQNPSTWFTIKINESKINEGNKILNEYAHQIETLLKEDKDFLKPDGSFDEEKALPVWQKCVQEYVSKLFLSDSKSKSRSQAEGKIGSPKDFINMLKKKK